MNQEELSNQIDIEITKAFYLCLLINRYSKKCVFFNMSGHIANVEMTISNSKKDWNHMPVRTSLSYNVNPEFHWERDNEKRLSSIKEQVEFFETICKEDKIPYDLCRPIEEVVSYRF